MPANLFVLVDGKERERVDEMCLRTWEDVQTGVSTYRRAKRGLITYFHTHIQTTTGVDAVEAVVSIGTGIAIAVLTSAVIAASVGTFGALPIGMVIAGFVALIAKKIFAAVRSKYEKDTVLAWLEKVSNGGSIPDPTDDSAHEDEYLATAIIHEYAKDFDKIENLIPMVARDSGLTEAFIKANLRGLYLDGKNHHLRKNGKLTDNYGFGLKYAKYTPSQELMSRLHRTEKYSKWMDAYFTFQLGRVKDFAEDQGYKDAENFIMKEASFQASQSGLHASCQMDLCLNPAQNDLTTRPLTPQETAELEKRSKFAKILQNPAERNGLLAKMRSANSSHVEGAEIDLPVLNESIFSEIFEVSRDVVIDTAQSMPFALSTSSAVNQSLQDPIANLVSTNTFTANAFSATGVTAQTVGNVAAGTAASAAAMAPVGLLVGKSVQAAIQYATETKPLKEKVGAFRNLLHKQPSEDDFKSELKQIFTDEVGGYAVSANVALRALNLAVRHYPGRIKERLEKLKSLFEKLKVRNHDNVASVFTSCSEAHKAVRYVLKVHHYTEKMIVNLALARVFSDQLKKKVFYET